MGKGKKKKKATADIIAVVDIGSSAIRVIIAELGPSKGALDATWRILDSAERPVSLGRDVFEDGVINSRTILEALEILRSFNEMMAPYPVKDVIAIGTSALREARNSETFIDRVRLQTGINVRVIEGIEANQLTYIAVKRSLTNSKPSISRSNALIMEVGGGSTELMLLNRGKMIAAHTLPIGTVRIQQQLAENFAVGGRVSSFLREQTRSMLDFIESEIDLKRISNLVAVGGDARMAASKVGTLVDNGHSVITTDRFHDFIERLEELTLDEIVNELNISYTDAEPLLAALLVYAIFFEATSAKTLVVPSVSIREGILINFAARPGALRELFHRQIIASAHSLAEHYHSDTDHAAQVTKFSLKLFDALQHEHGLDKHCRTLLEVAAILHDIGAFISGSSHHKHGQYIINNSELFGLSSSEKGIISNTVRYHRKAKPQSSHGQFMALDRDERIVITKLAAILRVADSLDRAHNHRLNDISVDIEQDQCILRTNSHTDLSLERYSLKNKRDLFQEVFGLRVVLR